MSILIGTDPEMFLYDETVGHIISAHAYVPGTKDHPLFVRKGAVQLDGVAAEFNIFPAGTRETFIENIRSVQETLLEIIRFNAEDQGHPDPSKITLVAEPTAEFSREYFKTIPDSSKILGCMPDYNAYSGEVQSPTAQNVDKSDRPFRTGGFHIHVGWTENKPVDGNGDHFELCLRVAKQMDMVIFPFSKSWDSDEKRRELYGARGSFRPKSYGMEYRSLSNAALKSDEILGWLFDVSVIATDLALESIYLWDMPEFHTDDVQRQSEILEAFGFPALGVKELEMAA